MSQVASQSPAPETPKAAEKEKAPPSSIFRKAALERLSSPEQLDYLMSITSPVAWIALAAVGVIAFLIILWGFIGFIPAKVSGKGILLRGGSVFDVSAGSDGVITDLPVKPGDVVQAGQSIAAIGQSGLDLKILLARRKLNDLSAQDADI